MMTTDENMRLIRHGGHPLASWSLLQRLADTGSHKRAIWIPIQTQLSQKQVDRWMMKQVATGLQALNH